MKKAISRLTPEEKKLLRKQRVPRWIEPMKATLTKDYFSDPEWIFERKWDGIRCIAFKSGSRLRMLSRNRLDLADRYPSIAEGLKAQSGDFVLDGEIAAVGKGDKAGFGLLQQARHGQISLVYLVFDVMHAEGFDVRPLPLITRREVLSSLLSWRAPLQLVEQVERKGEVYFRQACKRGWEGVIAKRALSGYSGSRSKDWLKFKCSSEQELVIGGFTDPQGARSGFGALLVGYYADGDLHYAGKVGTGFNAALLQELRSRLDRLERDAAPFVELGKRPPKAHWVEPTLVAQIAFSEWTGDGRLRHPSFVGLRDDKDPREVVRENPR